MIEKSILEEYIEQGLTWGAMAEKLDTYTSTVGYWLNKYELKSKTTATKDKFNYLTDTEKKARRKRQAVESVKTFRTNTRNKLIEYKNGCCEKCGYNKLNEVLEFHHTNPKIKKFKLSKSEMGQKWEMLIEEADKCMLLCANCHREEHVRLRNLD